MPLMTHFDLGENQTRVYLSRC